MKPFGYETLTGEACRNEELLKDSTDNTSSRDSRGILTVFRGEPRVIRLLDNS
jgi:hypothetical protein